MGTATYFCLFLPISGRNHTVNDPSIIYTYTDDGKLETREWKRLHNGYRLKTTYTYDTATGELLTIDYTDDTPDVEFVYDRLGRRTTIEEGTLPSGRGKGTSLITEGSKWVRA